jgi:predicted amidohydrolase YtcJ
LKYFDIDRYTPDPPAGVILKDTNGNPTGILKEEAAEIASEKIPKPSYKDDINSVKAAQNHLLKLGITGVGECDGDTDLFSIYNELDHKGQLLLRVFKMIPRDNLKYAIESGLKTGIGSEHFRVGCLKLFADGALGSQTAYMFKPYENSKGDFGVETMSCREIEDCVKRATDAGISIAIHAIGDRANYQALSSIGKYLHGYKRQGLRPRVEHAQILKKTDIKLFKSYNIIASVQPIHATSDRDIADRYWGDRSRYAYPFKTFLRMGAKIAFGSDAPIETANPMAGIHAAVTRKRPDENRRSWYPEERLSPAQALAAYTKGSSYACCYDDICGTISVGKRADFVVLSEDIFKTRPANIANTDVLMTIIDGQISYMHSD